VRYTHSYDAELAVETLKGKKNAKIGIVGKGTMSAAFYEHLKKNMPDATFADAADLVDQIKAIKSEEELAVFRHVAEALEKATIAVVKATKALLEQGQVGIFNVANEGKRTISQIARLIGLEGYVISPEELCKQQGVYLVNSVLDITKLKTILSATED
jgi:hypothetical protein